jgi:hypothetical protein
METPMKFTTILGFAAGIAVTMLALQRCKHAWRMKRNLRSDCLYDIGELMAQAGM